LAHPIWEPDAHYIEVKIQSIYNLVPIHYYTPSTYMEGERMDRLDFKKEN